MNYIEIWLALYLRDKLHHLDGAYTQTYFNHTNITGGDIFAHWWHKICAFYKC